MLQLASSRPLLLLPRVHDGLPLLLVTTQQRPHTKLLLQQQVAG